MRTKNIQQYEDGGDLFGQVSDVLDIMDAQAFAHEHTNNVTHDFINNSDTPEVHGFGYTLMGGMAVKLNRPGRVYTSDGVPYDLFADATVTLDAGDATLQRIDYIVAVIADEVGAEFDLIPFQELLSDEELAANTGPNPRVNYNVATQKHWQATIRVKKGEPDVVPTPPVLDDNEVLLYEVTVSAGLTALGTINLIDRANRLETLRQLALRDRQQQIDLLDVKRRLAKVEDAGGIELPGVDLDGRVGSLEEAINLLLRRTNAASDLPELRYVPARHNAHDQESAMLQVTSTYTAPNSYIDIETGGKVNFGDSEVDITPNAFDEEARTKWNPQFHTISSALVTQHARNHVAINVNNITPLASDGSVGFGLVSSALASTRAFPGVAASDTRYIEIFGGTSTVTRAALGGWYRFDTQTNTLTPRTITLATPPNTAAPLMIPCGDGNVLLGCPPAQTVGAFNNGGLWFRCNPKYSGDTTVYSESISTTVPTGVRFFGDLIAPGKIFIVAMQAAGGGDPKCWEYDVATNTFSLLSVSGSVPTNDGAYASAGSGNTAIVGIQSAGCRLRNNQFVMYCKRTINAYASTGRTLIFDRTTLTWTELNITAPWGEYGEQAETYLNTPVLTNFNGKPTFYGTVYDADNDRTTTTIYELTNVVPKPLSAVTESDPEYKQPQLTWRRAVLNVPMLVNGAAGTSLLSAAGVPEGNGVMLGGYDYATPSNYHNTKIYGTGTVGLIAGTFNGVTGVTLGQGSTFASFELSPFAASWLVAAYMAGLEGQYTSTNVKLEVSLDGGTNWQTIEANKLTAIAASSSPGNRRMRITIFRDGARTPIITGLGESFDSQGVSQGASRTVIRLTSPEDELFYEMWIDKLGKIHIDNLDDYAHAPSGAGRCTLMGIIANDSDTATLTRYINRRRPVHKVAVVKGAGALADVYSLLAVPVRFFSVRAIDASTKHAYVPLHSAIAPTGSQWRLSIQLTGTVATGDTFEVTFHG